MNPPRTISLTEKAIGPIETFYNTNGRSYCRIRITDSGGPVWLTIDQKAIHSLIALLAGSSQELRNIQRVHQTPLAPAHAPSNFNLTRTIDDDQIEFGWEPVGGATKYELQMISEGDFGEADTIVIPGNRKSHVVTAKRGINYQIRLRAVAEAGDSRVESTWATVSFVR